MNPIQRPDSYETADYTGVLRRRWWVVLVLAVVGVVGAFAYVTVAPKSYTSTAQVFVAPTGADQSSQISGGRTGGAVNLDTEAVLVQSGTVATVAAHLLHSPLTPYALSKEVAVTVPPNSQVLAISCTAGSAAGAAACANAFAAAYLQNRSATATASINGRVSSLQAHMTSLRQQDGTLSSKVNTLKPKSLARLNDQATLRSNQNELDALASQVATLQGEAANNSGGHVITKASPPGRPSSPKKSVVLPSGLAAGLVLGLIFAFILDRRDKRIHSSREVERLLDLPVMLDLPGSAFGHQISIASPRSRTGQAFTELGQAVVASLGEGSHILLVAGASPGPAGSVVASNLAAALTRTHADVVLICADLSDTVAPDLFGLDEGPGLTEVLAGTATVRDVTRGPAGVPGLWVIPPGADPALATYNLQHDRARALMSQLRRDAHYVVVEAQATMDGTDTFALAEFADAGLLAVEIPRTSRPEVIACSRRLNQMRTPTLGAAVLPPISPRSRVRPVGRGEARLGPGEGNGRDGLSAAGRGHAELPGLSGTSLEAADRRDGPVPSHDRYGDSAERAPGR